MASIRSATTVSKSVPLVRAMTYEMVTVSSLEPRVGAALGVCVTADFAVGVGAGRDPADLEDADPFPLDDLDALVGVDLAAFDPFPLLDLEDPFPSSVVMVSACNRRLGLSGCLTTDKCWGPSEWMTELPLVATLSSTMDLASHAHTSCKSNEKTITLMVEQVLD
jgi:hypothetical protein